MNESLHTVDGRPTLRIERRLAHRPEKVWRAVTEPDHLSQWYPFRVEELDLRVGGRIRFDDGEGTSYGAVITELDPPRVFAFSEHAPASMTRESDDLLRIELRPDGDGCVLVFTHTFDDRPAAASYATGWYGCLDALGMLLEGKPVEWPPMSVERYEAYVAAFGLAEGTAVLTPDGWQVRYERQVMMRSLDQVWAQLAGVAAASGQDPATATASATATTVGDPPPEGFTTSGIRPGPVTAATAPTLLEYAWEREGQQAGRVRWELSTGPGGARILLTQTGPSDLADLRGAALSAWQARIEAVVRDGLDGEA